MRLPMKTRRDRLLAGLVMSSAVVAGCGGAPTTPSASSPTVLVGFAGAPFSATLDGKTVSAEGAFPFTLAPGDHEIAGTFSSGLMVIAFSGGLFGGGGVRSGSLVSLQGVQPDVSSCSASWGDFTRRQQSFRLRFTVTTDSYAACQ